MDGSDFGEEKGSIYNGNCIFSDRKSLDELVVRTRVVLTVVGPYHKYGEPLVAACVKAGTHYCDLTGEPLFVRRMIDAYHEQAKSNGCRIVHCAGFDSIPSDLGTLFVATELQTKHNTKAQLVKSNFTIKGGGASGGTLASVVEMVSQPLSELAKAFNPYFLNTPESQAKLKGKVRPEERDYKWLSRDPDFGLVMPFIMANVNTRIVRRSASLAHENFAEKKNPYGSNFRYNETAKAPNYIIGALLTLAIALFFVLLRISFIRKLIVKYVLPTPGTGPSAETRAKARFRAELIAYGEEKGVKVRGEISGGDMGYDESAKMVAETALSLAFDLDSAPNMTGILTPATACGLPLIERLNASGITFKIVSTDQAK